MVKCTSLTERRTFEGGFYCSVYFNLNSGRSDTWGHLKKVAFREPRPKEESMSLSNSLRQNGYCSDRMTCGLPSFKKSRGIFLSLILLLVCGLVQESHAQDVAVKTNGLYLAATTPNIGMEVALNQKWTLDFSGSYNPWTFSDDKKMRFYLIQPELRYWLCEKFEGHFAGVHLHGAQYFGGFRDKRYDGYLAGGGITYGYDWILSPHWNLEAAIGIGYARLLYDKTPRIPCEKCRVSEHDNYYGPTKAVISLIYLF